MARGSITGRMEEGGAVWGTLSDEKGRQVATFTGTAEDGGRVHGRYQDRTGEVGTWEWEMPRE